MTNVWKIGMKYVIPELMIKKNSLCLWKLCEKIRRKYGDWRY